MNPKTETTTETTEAELTAEAGRAVRPFCNAM